MRLLRLEIENIASFENVTVDFTDPMLGDTDIFLISGETGSGKSTILDAICLALYGTTPRIEASVDRTQTRDEMPDSIALSDPCRLMRRGTGFCHVGLEFESGSRRYTATWSVQRAYKRPNGKFQKKVWQLRDEESGITLTSDREIAEKVQQLVGLDFAQFTRTTMLSQGKFAAFLQSRGDEKAELLKKITGVEKFATIGRRIYERTAALRNEAERRHREYEEASTNTLSPEETAALISHGEEIGRKAKAIDKETASVSHAADWMKAKADSEESLRKAEAEYAVTIERSRSKDFSDATKILDDRNRTGEAQRTWRRKEDAQEEIGKARRAIAGLEDDMRKNLALYAALLDRIEKETGTVAELQRQTDTHKDRIGIYDRGDALIASLHNVEQWRKAIADKEKRIAVTNKIIEETLRPQHQKSIESVDVKQKAVAALEESVMTLEEKLKESGLETLRKEKDRQLGAIASLERVKVLTDNVIKGEKTAAELRETISKLEDKLKESETLIMGAELLMKEKTGRLEMAREHYDYSLRATGKDVKILRATLHDGDTCPVCGHIVTDVNPLEQHLNEMLRHDKEQLAAAQKEKDEAVSTLAKLKSEKDALETQKQEAAKRLDKTARETGGAKAKAGKELEAFATQLPDNQDYCALLPEIDRLLAGIKEELGKTETDIAAGEKTAKNLDDERKKLRKETKALEKLKEEEVNAKSMLEKASAEVESLAAGKDVDTANIGNALAEVEKALGDTAVWRNEPRLNTAQFIDELKGQIEVYRSLKESLERHDKSLEKMRQEKDKSREELKAILAMMPQWMALTPATGTMTGNVMSLTALTNELTGNLKLLAKGEEESRELGEWLAGYLSRNPEYTLGQIAEMAKLPDERVMELQKIVDDIKKELAGRKANLDNARRRLEDVIKAKPEEVDADNPPVIEALNERLAALGREKEELLREAGAIKERLETQKKNDAAVAEKKVNWEKAKGEADKWEPLCALLGDATGRRFSHIALSRILQDLIRHANRYMDSLIGRYTLKVKPGTFVISVIDNDMGGLERTANTISGGETFLVSLALALALSDIAGLCRCDTLFIDEGFGSLSGRALSQAVDTLRSLHRQSGRRVGIISHIQQLREDIPVQLIVKKTGYNGASTLAYPDNL